jgi:hypothetical protein
MAHPPLPTAPKGSEARPAGFVHGNGGGGEDDLIRVVHVDIVIVMGGASN